MGKLKKDSQKSEVLCKGREGRETQSDMFGHVGTLGHVWTYIETNLDTSGNLRETFAHLDTRLDSVWTFGHVWTRLDTFGQRSQWTLKMVDSGPCPLRIDFARFTLAVILKRF